MSQLKDVLVLSVRKGFWASSETEAFPRRLYVRDSLRRRHNLLGDIELTLQNVSVEDSVTDGENTCRTWRCGWISQCYSAAIAGSTPVA
jgi:hypothetical protein